MYYLIGWFRYRILNFEFRMSFLGLALSFYMISSRMKVVKINWYSRFSAFYCFAWIGNITFFLNLFLYIIRFKILQLKSNHYANIPALYLILFRPKFKHSKIDFQIAFWLCCGCRRGVNSGICGLRLKVTGDNSAVEGLSWPEVVDKVVLAVLLLVFVKSPEHL